MYRCDPNKNTECNKRACHINGGPCMETKNPEYARTCEVCKHGKVSYQWVGHDFHERTAKYCPECGQKLEEVEQ